MKFEFNIWESLSGKQSNENLGLYMQFIRRYSHNFENLLNMLQKNSLELFAAKGQKKN